MSDTQSSLNVSANARPLSQVSNHENVQNVQENPNQRVDGNRDIQEVSSQLTQFLDRVSKRSTKVVDLADVKQRLSENGKLKKIGNFKTIFATAETVQKNMLRINSLSGEQIASAFDPVANEWKSGGFGDAIKAVTESLADLSQNLLELTNNPKVMADREMHAIITESYLKNCCRESEFATVLMSVVNLKHGEEQPLPGNLKLDLSQSLQSWMVKLAPNMHGTDSTLAVTTNPALKELATILDELKGDDRVVTAAERNRLLSALQTAKSSMHNSVADATTADKAFFREAEALLDKILHSMDNIKETAVNGVIKRHIEAFFSLPPSLDFSDELIDTLASEKGKCPNLAHVLKKRKEFLKLANTYLELLKHQKPGKPKSADLMKCHEDLLDLADDFHRHMRTNLKADSNFLSDELSRLQTLLLHQTNPSAIPEKLLTKIPQLPEPLLFELFEKSSQGDFVNDLKKVESTSLSLKAHLNALTTFISRVSTLNADDANTRQLLTSLFTQELPISSLVECRINGIRDEDIDLSLCDDNIASRKTFGAGGVNTVDEVTMNDGRVFIFKPESSGRGGLDSMKLAIGGYESDTNIAALNIAAHQAANYLGLGDLIVSARVGVCNGQIGFFMEKASGVDALDFIRMQGSSVVRKKDPNNPLEAKRFAKLSDAEFLKVNGQLMKQCYNLEWADFILGSGDRHAHNYFVNITENGTVGLKGIDNDMTFAKYRTSFSEISISGAKKKSFLMHCSAALAQNGGRRLSSEMLIKNLCMIDGITHNAENDAITIDLAKVKQPWLRQLVQDAHGMHQIVPPCFIDRALYNRLLELDTDAEKFEAYRNTLRNRMNEVNVDAAMVRLKSAIQYAKNLAKANAVIDDWEDKTMQMNIFDRHEEERTNYSDTVFQESLRRNINNLPKNRVTQNLYFRDFANITYDRLLKIN